jgi:hypothetical protein
MSDPDAAEATYQLIVVEVQPEEQQAPDEQTKKDKYNARRRTTRAAKAKAEQDAAAAIANKKREKQQGSTMPKNPVYLSDVFRLAAKRRKLKCFGVSPDLQCMVVGEHRPDGRDYLLGELSEGFIAFITLGELGSSAWETVEVLSFQRPRSKKQKVSSAEVPQSDEEDEKEEEEGDEEQYPLVAVERTRKSGSGLMIQAVPQSFVIKRNGNAGNIEE